MFLKQLLITNKDGKIRSIDFHLGYNLIIDETPQGTSETGNNVGKTTLLRLIDYCFGADARDIYTSGDGVANEEVKTFLKDTEVEVLLTLAESLTIPGCKEVKIRRNFLLGKKAVCEIDGQKVEKKDYVQTLQHAMWGVKTDRPSFRQIISHSFRIDDLRLSQSLRTLNRYTSDVEYETLHLYLFGANIDDADRKVELSNNIKQDRTYKQRLEKTDSISALRTKLAIVDNKIAQYNQAKASLKLNPDFESDLDHLTVIKHALSQLAVEQNNLLLRRRLIEEAAEDMKAMQSDANADQVAAIYQQAEAYSENLHHTFEELLHFHNEMLSRRADFITAELPELDGQIRQCNDRIALKRSEEKALEVKLNLTTSFAAFDELITQLNLLHQERGMLQQSIEQIEEVEKRIASNEEMLASIDQDLFSESRKQYIQKQLDKFNLHFESISQKLYEESYIIEFTEDIKRDGKPCYRFKPHADDNHSTGKKQGEITCFDLAYVQFADEEQIPCLHFILNDKRELMCDNQLVRAAQLADEQGNVQYVASILRDKLPPALNDEKYFVEKLSMKNRLFKIEEWKQSQ